MWNFISTHTGLFSVFLSASITVFLFFTGRALLGLDKWKTDSIAWFKRECDYNKAITEQYKKDIELVAESLKKSFAKEITDMKIEHAKAINGMKDDNAKYRQFCIFRIDEDIKKISDKRENNGYSIADLKAKHRYLEEVFGDIRQFYEENRSLLSSKADILLAIKDISTALQEVLGRLEKLEKRV